MSIVIIPLPTDRIDDFRETVGSVAREKKYLTFLDSPSHEMAKRFIDMMTENTMPQFVAVDEGDKMLGWCDISPINRPVTVHVGELGMGIIDGYRGQGIGERLIKATLDAAKKRGLTRIQLTVREDNERAIHLYEKLGFEREGLHKKAFLVDGRYENIFSMALLWV